MDEYPKAYLYRRIVQSKLYIDGNFADSIDLAQIADEAVFSKFHFTRLFKKIYGKTPHQYLTFVRIQKAKDLLKSGMAVHNVCYSVGFESISSFSELFKRMVGHTPSDFQIQQRQALAELHKLPLKFIPNCFAEKLKIAI
jgi:AraC-like DNA-binding protein